ncbi:MAG: COX15/CtaA family protein [Flavisolibacter sp.]|nr:COX15/CtaA family protein [Flavisolibacter sp.]
MSELQKRSDRIVANWIMIGVAMLIIQIILGGITRLTGSGLSITEWDVITGTLPPLNEQQWLQEFHKYQQTPQYRFLNFNFTLSDFKYIFFWEWFHRFWGRLIGIVFLIPFIIFLIQKRFRPEMVKPLLILFLLGALQGAVGWIMVASGLTGDAIYVKPTKLAMHFVLACILISYAFWFGLQLKVKKESLVSNSSLKNFTWVIIVLLFVQLVFGALIAGHKGASSAPTWPDINGSFIPAYVFKQGWIGVIENPIVVQFIHRSIAYLLVLLIVVWTIRSLKTALTPAFQKARWMPLGFVFIQVTLGIFTVLTSIRIRPAIWNVFEWMAQLHQLVAILLLLSLFGVLYFLQGKQKAKTKNTVEPTAIS